MKDNFVGFVYLALKVLYIYRERERQTDRQTDR